MRKEALFGVLQCGECERREELKGLYDFSKRPTYTKSSTPTVAGNLSHLTGLCGLMLAIAKAGFFFFFFLTGN